MNKACNENTYLYWVTDVIKDYRELFEINGWKIDDYYIKIIAVSPSGKSFYICDKVGGQTDYSKEIEEAFKKAEKLGLINNSLPSNSSNLPIGER